MLEKKKPSDFKLELGFFQTEKGILFPKQVCLQEIPALVDSIITLMVEKLEVPQLPKWRTNTVFPGVLLSNVKAYSTIR